VDEHSEVQHCNRQTRVENLVRNSRLFYSQVVHDLIQDESRASECNIRLQQPAVVEGGFFRVLVVRLVHTVFVVSKSEGGFRVLVNRHLVIEVPLILVISARLASQVTLLVRNAVLLLLLLDFALDFNFLSAVVLLGEQSLQLFRHHELDFLLVLTEIEHVDRLDFNVEVAEPLVDVAHILLLEVFELVG